MPHFVIVHGAFGGGWEWREVAGALRKLGHDVLTPTLTGVGDRTHLAHAGVDLSTHVRDVVSTLEFEGLDDVVLCGASYGGMPVTGAADAVPQRVRRLVYIDALVPRDGECALDLLPAAFGDDVRKAEARGLAVDAPADILPPQIGIPKVRRERYVSRLRAQPARTFTERIHLTGAVERLPRAFIRCTQAEFGSFGDPIAPFATRARTEGWAYRELAAPHDPHLFDPEGTAAVLDEIAGR